MAIPVLSKKAFQNWVKAQDPDQKYRWDDPTGCAIYQYAKSLGFKGVRAGVKSFVAYDGNERRFFGLFPKYKEYFIDGLRGHEIAQGSPSHTNTFRRLERALV